MWVPDHFGLAARERDKVRTNLDYETNNALLVKTIHPLAQTLFRISDAPNKKQRFPANYICIVKDLIKIKLFSGDPIICLRICPLWERRAKKTWAWKHTYHHSDANKLSLSFPSIEISHSPFSTFFWNRLPQYCLNYFWTNDHLHATDPKSAQRYYR